jgi:tetratricopeptide (TPR) repeat protein
MKSNVRAIPLAIAIACALSFAGAAHADDYGDVNRLLRAGQLPEALVKADQYLVSKPKDPQMRFLRGVILTEQGKPNDAIAAFNKLIEDYPELPEPYNNLAVLHAGQGQFDRARAALEMAIRTNPSYSTAHENLGDVYARLASQAYSKALQLDGGNTAINPKLNLIREIFSPNARGRAVVAAAPATAATPAPATAAKPAATAPATPAAPTAPPAASTSGEDDVRIAVMAWADAWSRRDMKDYLAAYGKDFDAPGGRKSWEEERRQRITGKSRISVKISNMAIKIDGNKARASFRQDYAADSLNVSSRKTLDLARAGNQWVIVREASGG